MSNQSFTDDTAASSNGTAIPGAGADAAMENRPGVPMEKSPPEPAGMAHWTEPDRQPDPGNILRRKGLEQLTPVFGDTIAPRGLSGAMRKAAYDIPEHYTSHWLLLMLSDRVDAIEGNMARLLPIAVPLVASGVLALALSARLRRRPRWKRFVDAAVEAAKKTARPLLV